MISKKDLSDHEVDNMRLKFRPLLSELHRLIFAPGSDSISKQSRAEVFSLKLKTQEAGMPKISAREQELMMLLSKGKSLKEVAKAMKISYFTAETHRKNIFKKFQTKSIAELIKKASKIFWLE